MSLPIENVQTVNASSSQPSYPYDNLNIGTNGPWRSDANKSLPAWLNFDLGKNFLLNKIRVISTNREMAPKEISVDYFGNDLRLIGRDIARVTFNAELPDYTKFQDFRIVYDQHSVKYVRIRILSNWGGRSVQLNRIVFFGRESTKGIKASSPVISEDSGPTYVPQKWYAGDRVRYRWEKNQKWYEGRILHVNESNDGITYLIKDDSGWTKDKIKMSDTREPRYPRKPRKLKASCSEISLLTIVEDLGEEEAAHEEEVTSGDDSLSDMDDQVENKKDKLAVVIPDPTKPLSSPKRNKGKVVTPKLVLPKRTDNRTKIINLKLASAARQQEKVVEDPPDKVSPKQLNVKLSPVQENPTKTPKKTDINQIPPVPITRTVPSGSSTTTSKRTGSLSPRKVKNGTLLAKNFKKKRLNGIYKQTSPRSRSNSPSGSRPMFKSSQGLVLWWFSTMKTWMISQQHQVGSNRSYAFVHDNGFHPLEIKGRWRTYNKMSIEKWDWDRGVITPPGQLEDEESLTLAEIIRSRSQRQKEPRSPSKPEPNKRVVTPEIEGDIVSWKVVCRGFRVSKLNSVYLRQKEQSGGRHRFMSTSGLVLWWYKRRQFWMISPQSLVGTDKSYACIQHKSMHPKDISGEWQVFDREQRRFSNDKGAMVHPGVAERIYLEGFPERLDLNGVFIEKRVRQRQQPSFLKYIPERNITLVLFFRVSTRKWCITKVDERYGPPLASCQDSTPIAMYKEIPPHPKLLRNGGEWKDGLNRNLKGRVV